MNPPVTHVQSLDNLREIALPPPVGYWPQTWGWLALALVMLALALWAAWRAYRRYRAQAWRREALRELDLIAGALDGGGPEKAALAALPALVKRAALATAGRGEVAGLSGAEWLSWLARDGQADKFASGPGRLLADIAYGRGGIAGDDARALVGLIRDWIGKRHAEP